MFRHRTGKSFTSVYTLSLRSSLVKWRVNTYTWTKGPQKLICDSVTLTTWFRSGIKRVNRQTLWQKPVTCVLRCVFFCANTTVVLAKFNTHSMMCRRSSQITVCECMCASCFALKIPHVDVVGTDCGCDNLQWRFFLGSRTDLKQTSVHTYGRRPPRWRRIWRVSWGCDIVYV